MNRAVILIRHPFVTIIPVLFSLNILLHRGADRNWDRAAYHDYVARAFTAGWLDSDWLAAGVTTWTAPFAEWPIIFFEILAGPFVGDILFGVFTAIGISYSIYYLAFTLFKSSEYCSELVVFSTLSGFLAPFFLSELGTTFASSFSAIPIVFSIAHLIKFYQFQNMKFIFYSALESALAVNLKLTNYIFTISLALCIWLVFRKKKIFLNFAWLYIAGLIPSILWWCQTYSKMRNPIFPFFNSVFNSPFFPRTNFRDWRWKFDGWNSVEGIFTGWLYGKPISELKSFNLLLSSALVIAFAWALFSLLFLVFGNTNVYLKIPTHEKIFLLWFLVSFCLWEIQFAYSRYFEALEILAGIVLSIFLKLVFSSCNFKTSQRLITLSILISAALMTLHVPNWTEASASPGTLTKNSRWASGLTSELKNAEGIILVAGSPVSFVRLTSPGLSHMIRIDMGKIPKKYVQEINSALTKKQKLQILAAGESITKSKIMLMLGDNLPGVSVKLGTCQNIDGPINVPYMLCVTKV